MDFIDRHKYDELIDSCGLRYWRKGREARWNYISIVIDLAKRLNPESVLEGGSMGIPLAIGGHTMEIGDRFNPTYRHNMTFTPWPVADKKYDLFMALQVWEHLEDCQQPAFEEVMRISRNAILSFPYKWKTGGIEHRNITKDIIRKWTCYYPPQEILQVKCRLIYRFEFNK